MNETPQNGHGSAALQETLIQDQVQQDSEAVVLAAVSEPPIVEIPKPPHARDENGSLILWLTLRDFASGRYLGTVQAAAVPRTDEGLGDFLIRAIVHGIGPAEDGEIGHNVHVFLETPDEANRRQRAHESRRRYRHK